MKSLFVILKAATLAKRLSNKKHVSFFLTALPQDVFRSVKHLANYVRIMFKAPPKKKKNNRVSSSRKSFRWGPPISTITGIC